VADPQPNGTGVARHSEAGRRAGDKSQSLPTPEKWRAPASAHEKRRADPSAREELGADPFAREERRVPPSTRSEWSGEAERTAPGGPASKEDDGERARYVAIITDGNGRWAQQRGLPVMAGHEAGADTVKARLRDAVDLGVEELTVYSFSTENWNRTPDEVSALMAMMARRIEQETPELHEEGVRMRFIGRRNDPVPPALVERMSWAEQLTSANTRITLFVAFNYGGRAEIVDAARTFTGETEAEFRSHLYAPEMHDPDLIIRTSGEQRISNYLLWQGAYSEFVFREELWPDFSREAFEESLQEFAVRHRRFGGR
jgi:undecaprenyl diphosphate synthase